MKKNNEIFDGKKTIILSKETIRKMQEESYAELKEKFKKIDRIGVNRSKMTKLVD